MENRVVERGTRLLAPSLEQVHWWADSLDMLQDVPGMLKKKKGKGNGDNVQPDLITDVSSSFLEF